jgi:hypothetical protein
MSYARMRQRKKAKNNDYIWLIVLVMIGVLFVCLLFSQPLRSQIGGKWSLPLIGMAFLAVLYLQPPIARRVHRWREDQRDEAEKRWWAERDRRERAALLRVEALRHDKTRERSRRREK